MMTDLRLAVPVGAAWGAVGILIGVPAVLPMAAIGLWSAALCALACGRVAGLRGSRNLRRIFPSGAALVVVALTLAVMALVVSVAAVRAPVRQPAELIAAANAGRHATVTVIATETGYPGRPFDATLTSVVLGTVTLTVAVPITVFPPAFTPGAPLVAIGSTVVASGALVAGDPGDSSAFRLFARDAPRVTTLPPRVLAAADSLRSGFLAVAVALPSDGGALLPGLAIGDTSAVSDTLDTAMKLSSLSHLTAVSGANCAVIIAIIMLMGARLRLPRVVRVAASSACLVGFVVLVTPQPSVLRAAVMAGIVLATMATGRPVSGLPVLALAVLVLLLSDPWLARSYGFVLSVLATAGLLLIARPLAARLSNWLPGWVALLIAIPLAAQLACQPVLLLLNPAIPTYGVVANVLAGPAAPLATVLGLLACVLLPILPPVALLIAKLAWLPSAWIAAVARFFVDLPGSSLPWPGGAVGVLLCTVVTGCSLAVALRVGGRRVRLVSAITLVAALVGFVGVCVGDQVRTQLSRPGDWQIAACDSGQGDAVLVRSRGQVALIDTGPDPGLLTDCLNDLGISAIDLLVLTHYDLDHVGGTAAVLGRVTRALVGPTADRDDERLAERLAAGGAAVEHVSQGLTGMLGELGWRVLWPKPTVSGAATGNDASVTLRFDGAGECAGGCLSAVFLGDLGEEQQGRVLAANPGLAPVDVVKVAHHGSADQNERMYQRLLAGVGIIGVGTDNGYGHPNDRLLAILQRSGTLATRTDLQGMVLVSPRADGGQSVWSERTMPAAKLTRH